MGKFLDSANRRRNNKDEEEEKKSSVVSENVSSSSRGGFAKRAMEHRLGLDTLESDLNTYGTTVYDIYNNWQTPETMLTKKREVQGIYNKLVGYGDYQKTYGGIDLSDLTNAYKYALDNWDSRGELYGQFQNADAYKAAVKDYQLSEKFKGLSYDRVQGLLRKYDVGTDEYNYLKNYTGYTSVEDFDKAIAAKNNDYDILYGGVVEKLEEYDNIINANSDYDSKGFSNDAIGGRGSGRQVAKARSNKEKLVKELGFNSEEEFYAYVDSHNKSVDDLETERNIYKLENAAFDKHKHVMQNEDFAEKSKYVSTEKKSWAGTLDYGDYEYEFINDVNGGRDFIDGATRGGGNGRSHRYDLGYDQLTNDEILIYNYYKALDKENGTKKAEEFLKDMEITLQKRASERNATGREIMLDDPMMASLFTIVSPVANLSGAIGNLMASGKDLITGSEYNPYDPMREISNANTHGREVVSQNIAEATPGLEVAGVNVPSFLYNTGLSMADSSLGGAAFGKAHTVLMGTNAYQQKAKELTEAGESAEVVQGNAMVSGLLEVGFEYIGFDNLMKVEDADTFVKVLVNGLKQSGVEGLEELGTEGGNMIADYLFRVDRSEFVTKYNDYIAQGYTEAEARSMIAADITTRLAEAYAGGALSGGGHGFGHSALQYGTFSSIGSDVRSADRVSEVLDIAHMSAPESAAYEAYTAYANRGVTADNISNAQLGNLYNTVKSEAQSGFMTANEDLAKAKETIYKQKTIRESETASEAKKARATEKLDTAIDKQTDAQVRRLKSAETLSKLEGVEKSVYESGIKKAIENAEAEKKAKHEAEVKKLSSGVETSVMADTDKAIEIKGMKDSDTIITSDGEVKLKDVELSDRDADLIVYARGMEASEANLYLEQYNGEESIEEYTNSFSLVTAMAKNNYSEDALLKAKGSLSTEQFNAIYAATVTEKYREKQRNIDKLNADMAGKMSYKGVIDDSVINYGNEAVKGKVKWSELNSRQREAITFISGFAKATGMNLKLIADGERRGINGSYDNTTNTITIDVYAGISKAKNLLKDTIIPTMSHETTHWMKEKSPELYRKMGDLVFKTLEAHDGISEVDRVASEVARQNAKGKNITDDGARDEIIARACEDMLKMSEEGKNLFNSLSESEKKTFIDKVKEILANLMEWVDNLLNSYSSDRYEAKVMREYKDSLAELSRLWDEMLVSSREANQSLEKSGKYEHKNNTSNGEMQFSDRITADMSDEQRYEILKKRTLSVASVNKAEYNKVVKLNSVLNDISIKKTDAKKILRKIADEFGVLGHYESADLGLEFEFGSNNLGESINKQRGNYDAYAQMLSCFSDVITNAAGIEVHNRNKGGYKPDLTLKNVYVLCSAFENDSDIVPVKLEVKEFVDKPNRLYVAVTLESIKKDRVVSMGVQDNLTHVRTSPVNISIADIFKNVNIKDVDFLKYIPNQFLNEAQIEAKNKELSKMWDEMLVSSVQNNSSMELAGVFDNARKALSEVGLQIDADTNSVAPSDIMLSERTWSESEYVQNRDVAIKAIVKALGVSEADATRYVDNINGIARMIADDFVKKYGGNDNVQYDERDYPIDPEIEKTVNSALNNSQSNMHVLSTITQAQNNAINRLVNTTKNDSFRGKFTGGKHLFSDNAVRHSRAEHGDFLREALRGQLPITPTDIARHLSAVKDGKQPKDVKPSKTKEGYPSIVTAYEVNGYTLYAEEIKKTLGKDTPSDLIGHTMYKAPTLPTAAFYTTGVQTQPKRQGMVLCEYYTTKSNNLSRGNFVADKNGQPALLSFIVESGSVKQDAGAAGLIALSSDSSNFTDKSGSVSKGYVVCKKPFYITTDNRVFSNSETNVAERINELKKKGYDCFIFDKYSGDNYLVAVVNKAQIVSTKPTEVDTSLVQNSDRDDDLSVFEKMGEAYRAGYKKNHPMDDEAVQNDDRDDNIGYSYKNPDLTDNDLSDYLRTGKTLHTRNKKQRMLELGKKPILTSSAETKKFISDIIHGKAPGEVRAFKKIGRRLSEAIQNKRKNLNMLDKYLELNADDLREAYKRHSLPKEKGDIPLSEQDFERIPEYIDNFDGVLSVDTYHNKIEVHLYKETEDGYVKILTVVSSERNSLQVTKLIGNSREKFEKKYAKKIEGNIGSLWSQTKDSFPSTTAQLTADVPSVNSIHNSSEKSNEEIVNNDDVQNDDRDDEQYSERLTEADLNEYLVTGTRRNIIKQKALAEGKKIILTSQEEINNFIHSSIRDATKLNTVGYGKVNQRLYNDVNEYSDGKINISGSFLELVPFDISHAYEQHLKAKEDGDIDLSMSDFENIPNYIDTYDELLYAIKYKSGSTRICVSKKVSNGRVLIIETVSKSRNSISFKNMIGVTEEKYENKYKKEYKKRNSPNPRGSESSNISLRDETISNSNIPYSKHFVKSNFDEQNSDRDDDVSVFEKIGEAYRAGYKKNHPMDDEAVQNDDRDDFSLSNIITVGMSDAERYEILKDKIFQPQEIEIDKAFDIDFKYLEDNAKRIVEAPLIKKLEELTVFKKYQTVVVSGVDFEFTKTGFRKSINSQESDYGGNKADFAKVILNLQKLLDNSVLIETHTDKAKGTHRENLELKQVYVLMSAYKENGFITPVQFEIKQYVNDDNRLYLAVALTKIETSVMGNAELEENQVSTSLLPVSDISITDLFKKVNPIDKNFLKYIPNQFLDNEQITAKNKAIELEKRKYSDIGTVQNSDRDDDLSVFEEMGEAHRLEEENAWLKEDIKWLKERIKLEGQVTNGKYFKDSSIVAAAEVLLKKVESKYDKVQLARSLRDLYHFIRSAGSEADADAVMLKAHDIARQILSGAKPMVVKNDYYAMLLSEIKKTRVRFNKNQKAECGARIGKNWNRSFFGKIIIADDARSELDQQWKEWAEEYPDIFDANIKDGDQPMELRDILASLKANSEIVEEYNNEENAMWLVKEILNQYWNLTPLVTTADKYSGQIKELNAKHRQKMKEARDDYNARVEEAKLAERMFYGKKMLQMRKEYDAKLEKQRKSDADKLSEANQRHELELYEERMHFGAALAKLRRQRDERVAEAKERGRQRMAEYKENVAKNAKIKSITSNALELAEKRVKNSKDMHIPEAMIGPVDTLLDAINFSSKHLLNGGEPTKTDISLAKSLSKIKDMMAKASVKASDELIELYGHGLDESIEKMVENVDRIVDTIGDNEFVLNRMSLEDLQTLDMVVKTIKQAVNKLNKFHVVNHAKGIANLSQESMVYLDSLGKGKFYDGMRGKISKLLNWNNTLPYYAFKRYGEGGATIYEAFQDGWDKFAFNVKAVMDCAKSAYTNEEVKAWSKEVKVFNIPVPAKASNLKNPEYKPEYQKIQMTVPQIMSMYCLNKRVQARGHFFGGGIRVADFKDGKGKIVSQSDGIVFMEKDISAIFDTLTDRQKAVADKLQEFMNTVCTDWGNEVSMARFGYKAFGEANYFPIQSDKNNLAVDDETEQQNSLFRLLNMSFTKSLDDKANNRIVISDIFDVFAQHASDMAKYNALALPVLDAFRWYNYKEKEGITDGSFKTTGVKQSIENAFGKDGQSYFTTFLKDINGQQEVSRDTLGKGFFSNAKIASVGANLRVVALQPTSYVRASAVIDGRYLTRAFVHKPKIDKAEKWCGIALWKSMGYYDTNIQRGVVSQIKHDETRLEKAKEKSMKLAEMADKVTWGYLWNACELEIRDKRKDLEVGSDEFFIEVGKRLREVIYATQVVDSTMTRSQMMRSSQFYDKMLTAFASEPTLSYNMLQDAYMGYRLDARQTGKADAMKKNGKKIARTLLAYTVTNALAALVESGFDAFREDDDEDEMDLETFMKYYLDNFLNDMSITSKIPYIKEAHSIIKGFGSSRTDTQWMDSMVKAGKAWAKTFGGEGNAKSTIKHTLKAFSDLSGLPFYNAYRDSAAFLDKTGIFTSEDLNEMFEDFFN